MELLVEVNVNVTARLGPTGIRLAKLMQTERPGIYKDLWVENSLNRVLFEAEQHFIERMIAHNEDYQSKHKRPSGSVELLQYLSSREAYVTEEIRREMLNWVSNYPNNAIERA